MRRIRRVSLCAGASSNLRTYVQSEDKIGRKAEIEIRFENLIYFDISVKRFIRDEQVCIRTCSLERELKYGDFIV